MAIKRPTSVIIGNMNWTVEYLTDEEWDQAHIDRPGLDEDPFYQPGNRGETQFRKQNIAILLPFGAEDQIRDVLLHEIMHAIWGAIGMAMIMQRKEYPRDPFAFEEFLMLIQAPGFLAFLRQNFAVVQYLQGL